MYEKLHMGYLCLFAQPGGIAVDRIPIRMWEPITITRTLRHSRLSAWWWVMDTTSTERLSAQRYKLGGYACVDIQNTSAIQLFDVYDASDGVVAKLTLHASWEGTLDRVTTPLFKHDSTIMDGKFERELRRIHDVHIPHTNIVHLKRGIFSDLNTPVGRVPTWSFPWMYTKHAIAQLLSPTIHIENYMLRMMYLAMFKLGYPCDYLYDTIAEVNSNAYLEPAKWPFFNEVIAEMTSLVSRSTTYQPDYSRVDSKRTISTDEWERLWDSPDLSRSMFDCEDFAMDAMMWSALLREGTFSDTALQFLQRHERKMYSAIVICTLECDPLQPKKQVYHCVCMKLDKRWVLRHLVRDDAISSSVDGKYIPAVLIDGTTQATSAKGYSNNDAEMTRVFISSCVDADKLHHSDAHISMKAPLSLVDDALPYPYVQSIIIPELVDSHHIYQMELTTTINNWLGVPMRKLWDYDTTSINAWIPMRSSYPTEHKSLIQQVIDRYIYMPPLQLPRIDEKIPVPQWTKPLDLKDVVFDGLVRGASWNDSILSDMRVLFPADRYTIHTASMELMPTIKLVRCIIALRDSSQ
jgi:hypothetical protein